jgi:predicted dehydrogenase
MTKQVINTALLSYGMSGEIFHAPLLTAHPGFKLSKILERSKGRARQRYPGTTIVRTLEEILGDETIELVVVNTPHETHYELTTKVLESGKHVIVEKPFVNNSEEGEQLIRVAKDRERVISVFQNRRWDGDFMTVRKLLKSGLVGSLVEFEAHYDRYRPQVDHSTWKERLGPGSGILYNLGAHMLDQALVLFGTPDLVTADVGIKRKGGTAADYYDIRLTYKDHVAIVKSSYLVREPGPRYIVNGVEGSFIKFGLDPQEQALKDGGIPGTPSWGQEPVNFWGKINTQVNELHVEGRIETFPGNYLGFYDNIFGVLRNGEALEVTAEQALSVIRIIELAITSSDEGRSVPGN